MAALTVDAIDLVLREAKVCNAQLNCIHQLLNDNSNTGENEERRRSMEANTAMIFRDMVSYLYSVLDQIFYFLYCHFQNNGRVSFTNAAFNINQPISFKLKYSPNPGEDLNHPECTFKKNRNDWVEEQCTKIFGDQYYQNDNLNSRLAIIRNFQKELLSIQAIKEVDKAGKELSANGGVKLVSACNIQHQELQAERGEVDHRFNPTIEDFQTLPSVENIDSWNFALIFNLLHFFRNFTTHRTLIESRTKPGYLNLHTWDLKPIEVGQEDQLDPAEWKYIAKGSWIKVPELSHLRQNNRDAPVTFHWHPILLVSSKLCWFVRTFRDNILGIVEGVHRYDTDDTCWPGSGATPQIALKRDGIVVGTYAWDSARLHAAD